MRLKNFWSFRAFLRNDSILSFEIGARVVLFIIFLVTDDATPFRRKIQPEEVWLYKFPHSEDIIPASTVHFCNVVTSIFVVWIVHQINKNVNESVAALLGVSLSTLLSLVIANFIKLAIGRPRPDFFERCFYGSDVPFDHEELATAACTGPYDIVIQGYKSFPSGHSSMAFGCMAYLSFYLAWSLKVFQPHQRRFQSVKMCAFLTPLVLAVLVAASRTCDYHHHWQDVTVGSILGVSISYICYRQGFPSFFDKDDRTRSSVPTSPPARELLPLSAVQTF